MKRTVFLLTAMTVLLAAPARADQHDIGGWGSYAVAAHSVAAAERRMMRGRRHSERRHHRRSRRYDVRIVADRRVADGEVRLLPHPAGCHWRNFCGCGAAQDVFGAITGVVNGVNLRDLWLASNWIRLFPRAEPAPGMALAREGHVAIIRQVLPGGRALVYDANSGRHATRLHIRSMRGFAVVDPHGRRTRVSRL